MTLFTQQTVDAGSTLWTTRRCEALLHGTIMGEQSWSLILSSLRSHLAELRQ